VSFDWYLDLLRHIREKYPHINIHGSVRRSCNISPSCSNAAAGFDSRFKEAGLGSVPGGGGEILVDSVRNRIAL